MTLIVTINGRESIWLLADRRLSCKGRTLRDDARKLMILETRDGDAILGYAGLGATTLGTEPADWMSAVLRGRNLPLEHCLGLLAEAAKKQLPRHMSRIPGPGGPVHNVIVTAFLNEEVRLYTIDIVYAPDRKTFKFRWTRHVSNSPVQITPPVGVGGSGELHLSHDESWVRPLLHIVKAYERGKVTPLAVADHFAKLNYDVHRNTPDGTVGPSCIVAWRNRKAGRYKGGGGHQCYTKDTRDRESIPLPTIAHGMDIKAIADVIMPSWLKAVGKSLVDENLEDIDIDKDEINDALANLPNKPDEQLR